MKDINFPMLLLAMSVVAMFCFSGIAMAYNNLLFVTVFILLGFVVMGYGLVLKRKKSDAQ